MISSPLRFVINSVVRNMSLFSGELRKLLHVKNTNVRDIHITSNDMREFKEGKQKIRSTTRAKNVYLEGELNPAADISSDNMSLFPTASTPNEIFNGIQYCSLPIINIKASRNNTIMTATDHKGKVMKLRSAGIEGFKNAKKSTNIAAQQTAYSLGVSLLKDNIKTVRVRIQGIGAGRSGSLKGLQLAELSVVSITDDTRVSWNPPRPRKQRRI